MTGGPDGDLGSNEILISRDRILSIIDGSGVLYDPSGINREELKRLARGRKTVSRFDRTLLSDQGFLVTVKDRDIALPDGEKVSNGLEFRNFFHLNPKFQADLFIPCGGRPASININNWAQFVDNEGRPRFKIISEGANLFITQQARLRLEEKGVIFYKDASANKGGVTSSSLEVFASLALTDEEYDRYMCVKAGKVPEFRRRYVEEILELIRANSTFEFKVIEREKVKLGIPRVSITDRLSDKINLVADAVFKSELDRNRELFRRIIECCCPQILLDTIGFDALFERIPSAYLKAVFASRLASRYVYEKGLEANEIDFFQFVNSYNTL
jgi:glutamate dehydrogenase